MWSPQREGSSRSRTGNEGPELSIHTNELFAYMNVQTLIKSMIIKYEENLRIIFEYCFDQTSTHTGAFRLLHLNKL